MTYRQVTKTETICVQELHREAAEKAAMEEVARMKMKAEKTAKKFRGKKGFPQKPTVQMSSYFLFVQEKRATLPASTKVCEVAMQRTEMWTKATLEGKKVYDDKAKAAEEEYEKAMVEYRDSDGFKMFS